MTTLKTVIAIDPGTHKCGMALVSRLQDGQVKLVWHEVVPTTGVIPKLHEAYSHEPFSLVIMGGGTGCKPLLSEVREHLPSVGTLVLDESNTTLQARERYWEHHPRRGWRRLLPATLQTPPVEYDDYVAMILAERVLLQG